MFKAPSTKREFALNSNPSLRSTDGKWKVLSLLMQTGWPCALLFSAAASRLWVVPPTGVFDRTHHFGGLLKKHSQMVLPRLNWLTRVNPLRT